MLSKPELVEAKSVEELKKLALEYPYSQPVQLIYAIRLSQSSEYLFNRQLGRTSILTDDRSVLFDLFEREQDSEIQSETDERHIEISVSEKSAKPTTASGQHSELSEERINFNMKEEHDFPEDHVEEKLVKESTEDKKGWPEDKSEVKAGVQSHKMDLSGLSPSEKVKAILEENRRLREEFSGKTTRTVAEVPETNDEPENSVRENESTDPIATAGPAEEVEEQSVNTEEETEIFSIEEEKQEPVFAIDGEERETEVQEVVPITESEEEHGSASDIAKDNSETLSKDSSHSFGEWLHLLQKPAQKEGGSDQENKPESRKPDLKEKISLLDTFVEKLPELKKKTREKKNDPAPSVNMDSISDEGEDGSLVTETLARVYIKQRHFDKAIKAYEIMKLKYPEKSSFFADRISEIKKLSNSK